MYVSLVALQSKVSHSTCSSATDAELIGLEIALKKALSIGKLLVDTKVIQEKDLKIVLREDNQGAIKSLKNRLGTSGIRHLRIKLKWIRELIQDGIVTLEDTRSDDNWADIFTKPLPGPAFRKHAITINPNLKKLWVGNWNDNHNDEVDDI